MMSRTLAPLFGVLIFGSFVESVDAAALRFSTVKGGPEKWGDITPWDARLLAASSLRKPPRGLWGSDKTIGNEDEEGRLKVGDFKCGVTMKTTSADDKHEVCPGECPYFAQDLTDSEHCTFVCVNGDQCAAHNPNRPIAGEVVTQFGDKRFICRSPMVQHCLEYDLTGGDRCKVCNTFFYLGEDGQCWYQFAIVLWGLLVLLIVIVVVLVVWITDSVLRGNAVQEHESNQQGFHHGLEARELALLRKPKSDDASSRDIWPLRTNLCTENVAGAGMVLHFNFQAVVIFWALAVCLMWYCFIWFVDSDLAILGTKKFGTPRQNCILVAWGYETQKRLMWTKVWFLAAVYIFTFVGCLLHGVRQLRIYQAVDGRNKTMADFAAFCTGLPVYKGSDRAEDTLKKGFSDTLGQGIVGVSICWDFNEDNEMIGTAIDNFIDDYVPKVEPLQEVKFNAIREYIADYEASLFCGDPPEKTDAAVITKKLEDIGSSDQAIVVFETEALRDKAVERSKQDGGIKVCGNNVLLTPIGVEPENINWENFGHSVGAKTMRFIAGLGKIGIALLLWAGLFYAPYAWSIFTWNYDNGQQPPFIYGFAFSMVVCIGNAIMYIQCDNVATNIGFAFKDSKETCYMVMYTVACTLNILLDLVTTYYTALYVMTGLNFRTYHGTKLEDLGDFHGVFESYAIQRSLAESAYQYAWPSTYLIPFLLEPIMTIWLPLQLMKMVVRAQPKVQGKEAEEDLAPAPMELGRYADLLLNMFLAILIFYFPGGYTHSLFFWMAVSHIYIYAYDHWKVLRGIPSCTFANMEVDWWAQFMLAPCCGMILACYVFKSNCQEHGYCLGGGPLALTCFSAFLLHSAIHILMLLYVVPMLGGNAKQDDELANKTFKDISSSKACSWFTANPMHCLRSKYIYAHNPPCVPFRPGKEHLLQSNDEIGCHFSDVKGRTSFSVGSGKGGKP